MFDNGGTVEVQSGTVYLNGGFVNFAGTTLTGGTYIVNSTFKFTDADIVTNAATIVLDGPASQIVDQSNNDGLANFAANDTAASFTIINGRDLTTPGTLDNAGDVTVGSGSTLTVTNGFVQTAGSTTLDNATLRSTANPVDLQGGVLQGDGTVDADLINDGGTVAPGMPVGQLHVTGNYTQTAGGEFSVELAGMAPGSEFDVLAIDGDALLDGTLTIGVLGGFAPKVGSMFDILTAKTRNGVFFGVNAPCLPGANRFLTTYDATTARLEVVNPLRGDLNCDCSFDGGDIDPFFLALGDPAAYAARFPNCDPLLGDMNGDGRLDGGDIDPFFACLGGACP